MSEASPGDSAVSPLLWFRVVKKIVADEKKQKKPFPTARSTPNFSTNLNGKMCWHDASSFRHDSKQIFYVLPLLN